MFNDQSFKELLEQKRVRLALAAVCIYLAFTGAYQLLLGENEVDWLRGGGNLLVWGGFAVLNIMKAFGRTLPGINIPINIGVMLVIAGWVARL